VTGPSPDIVVMSKSAELMRRETTVVRPAENVLIHPAKTCVVVPGGEALSMVVSVVKYEKPLRKRLSQGIIAS
jgi:hypothetical protein